MSYATQDDLIEWCSGADELVKLTDLSDPPSGALDATRVAKALTRADNTINSYIGGLQLDLTVVPQSLADAACKIARYNLWSDGASAKVRTDYTDAIAWLKDVQAGRAQLGDASGNTQTVSAGAPQFESKPANFSRCKMDGF